MARALSEPRRRACSHSAATTRCENSGLRALGAHRGMERRRTSPKFYREVASMMTSSYDVAIIGGGPAGSTCARTLVAGGARVVVIAQASFPRVKLCAGWLSPGIWDVLQLSPREYPRGLWPWNVCHVHYQGKDHAFPGKG